MIKVISLALRWCMVLGAKFIRVVPGATVTIVLTTLVSQIALLLAFFLPLKVVILLGSSTTPRYFPDMFLAMERQTLIIVLSSAAVVCYVIYLLAESLIRSVSGFGASQLQRRSEKMALFENQADVAVTAYQRYTQALASGVFIILALIILSNYYPALALLTLGYSAFAFVLFVILFNISTHVQELLYTKINPLMQITGGIGFLLGFAYLVADSLLWTPPGLIVAIISLLLVRQALNRGAALISDVSGLFRQRLKLNALFLHGHVLEHASTRQDTDYWTLLDKKRRDQWLSVLLDKHCGETVKVDESAWTQSGVANITALAVNSRYFVKIFNTGRRTQAIHEATLLTEIEGGKLPALPLLGVDRIAGFNCHVFDDYNGNSKSLLRIIKSEVRAILGMLWGIEPPASLVDRYQRSRLMLVQRLTDDMLIRLRWVVVKNEHQAQATDMSDRLDEIKAILSSLPLCIHNPDVRVDTIAVRKDGASVVTHWGRWSLEPLGAGWPTREADLRAIPRMLATAAETRPSLRQVSPAHVRLAALMFSFDALYQAQSYHAALDLMPGILACLEVQDQAIVRRA